MADDITRLIFEVSQKGTAQVEKEMQKLEKAVAATAEEYLSLDDAAKKSGQGLAKHSKSLIGLLGQVEKQAALAGKQATTMLGGPQMRKQEQAVRKLRMEYDGLLKDLTKASHANDVELQKAIKSRMNTVEKLASKEIGETNRLYEAHKKKFQELVNTEKKSLASLTANAMSGGVSALQQIRGGNIGGAVQSVGGGIQGLGQQAGARSVAGGGAAGGQMMKMMGSFAKVAGPLALAVGSLGILVKLFLDFDSRLTDINKSLLKNIPLTSLAASGYGDMESQVGDAKDALKDLQRNVLTNVDLKNLGLNPDEMGGILSTMHEQGMQLGDLRQAGVDYASALEIAQVAALNLGVDAQTTASFIGELADVSALSFDQAAASLQIVVQYATEAGVSSKKFFGVVQGLVGEMGLYNYKIAETAGLYSKLTKVMDAKSAEEYARTVQSGFKDMSAGDKATVISLVGEAETAKMVAAAAKDLGESLDPEKLKAAFKAIGEEDLLAGSSFAEAFAALKGKGLQNALIHAADGDLNQKLGQYRRMSEAKGLEQLTAVLNDLSTGFKEAMMLVSSRKIAGGSIQGLAGTALGEAADVTRQKEIREATAMAFIENAKSMTADQFDVFAQSKNYGISQSDAAGLNLNSASSLAKLFDSNIIDPDAAGKQKLTAEETAAKMRSLTESFQNTLLGYLVQMLTALETLVDMFKNSSIFGGGTGATRSRASIHEEQAQIRTEMRELKGSMVDGGTAAQKQRMSGLQGRLGFLGQVDASMGAGVSYDKSRRMATLNASEKELEAFAFAGQQQELARGVLKGAQFEYGDSGLGGWQGRSSPDFGAMTKLKTAKGEVLEGAALASFLDKLDAAGMARGLLETGASIKEVEETLKGKVELAPKTLKRLGEEVARAQREADAMEFLTEMLGVQGANDAYNAFGRGENIRGYFGSEDAYETGLGYLQDISPTTAYDARMVTGGIPFLNLQPGDIIVDQEALAQTMAGGKGSLVPDLLARAGAKGGAAGGGSSRMLNANFYINGGNVSEVRTTILKVLEEWERARVT